MDRNEFVHTPDTERVANWPLPHHDEAHETEPCVPQDDGLHAEIEQLRLEVERLRDRQKPLPQTPRSNSEIRTALGIGLDRLEEQQALQRTPLSRLGRNKVLTTLFLPIAVMTLMTGLTMTGLTVFGPAEFAQDYETGLQPAPSAGPAGNAMSSGAYSTTVQPSSPTGARNAARMGIKATLLGLPVTGTAPLTVDFHVGLTNPHGSLVYKWNFGDGTVSLRPPGLHILHVYQNPGTYLCSLDLTTAQGSSTTLLTTIVVGPSHS